MEKEVFEQFYAHVRSHQYLQFILQYAAIKRNFIPTITTVEKNIVLTSEIEKYFNKFEANRIKGNIMWSIVHVPRTYIYPIDESGKYVISGDSTATDNFEEAMKKLKAKRYQKIDLFEDAVESLEKDALGNAGENSEVLEDCFEDAVE